MVESCKEANGALCNVSKYTTFFFFAREVYYNQIEVKALSCTCHVHQISSRCNSKQLHLVLRLSLPCFSCQLVRTLSPSISHMCSCLWIEECHPTYKDLPPVLICLCMIDL